MNETFFSYDKKQNKWTQTEVFPMPPNYTPIMKTPPAVYYNRKRVEFRKKIDCKVFCKTHNVWETVRGTAIGSNGEKQIVTSCGLLAPDPYINDCTKFPFAYTVKNFANQNFISFTVFSVLYRDAKKIKDDLSFTISTVTGKMENPEKKFDIDNDMLSVPSEILQFVVSMISKVFSKDFGFVPTLTSKVRDISVISGYVKYPFNANLAELQKISGMNDFKIARNDSLNENKMFDFLAIKPSKALRKKYQEYPFAPIAWKFFEKLGFKDVNIIIPQLENKLVHDFLIDHWVRYECEEKRVVFNGDEQLIFFVEESKKLNNEKTVLSALMACLKTEKKSIANGHNFSDLFDSIDMIRVNFVRLPDAIKKEIFHDGILERTHDNLVTMFQSMDMELEDSYNKKPFPYSPSDLALEYSETHPKTGKTLLKFSLPKDTIELVGFGKKMHNCVGWGYYTKRVALRKTTIVAVYVEGKANMCLEINTSRKIIQALGVCNKRLNEGQRAIIKDWAARKTLNPGVVVD